MNDPLVTVILPVRNGEKLLPESIGSVLQQEYGPLELIIVDDGSSDGTARVAAEVADRVRYYYQPNSGPAAARNLGIREAKGEYIAFIDADDLWPEAKLRLQMNCFEAFPTVEIVQGLIRRIKLPGSIRGRIIGADIDFPFLYTNLGGMLIRRSVFDKIGYLDESLRFHEDTDFWLRAREAGVRILVQRRVALIYRIHGRNLTTGEDLSTTGFLKVLKKSIERRRESSGFVKPLRRLPFLPEPLQTAQAGNPRTTPQKSSRPPVSVVLSVGDHHAHVGRALESLRKQDYHPLELLVVGSRLDEVQVLVANQFEQVKWFENESLGRASQLNVAIKNCTGDLIAFLDADGEWSPGKLKTQVAYMHEHAAQEYVVGRTRHILQPGTKYPSELIDGLSFRKSLGDLLGTLIVRRSIFEQVGGFSTGLRGMEETDWLLRARDLGFPQGMLPEVLLYRFVQPDVQVDGVDQMRTALLKSVRASLHRKRGAHE
jgi:glycosyltransferase involved in cell wall biosynthesis